MLGPPSVKNVPEESFCTTFLARTARKVMFLKVVQRSVNDVNPVLNQTVKTPCVILVIWVVGVTSMVARIAKLVNTMMHVDRSPAFPVRSILLAPNPNPLPTLSVSNVSRPELLD